MAVVFHWQENCFSDPRSCEDCRWQRYASRQRGCFYCLRDVAPPYVVWLPAWGEGIKLHPECVLELAIRLFRDVLEIEQRRMGELHFVRYHYPPQRDSAERREEGPTGSSPGSHACGHRRLQAVRPVPVGEAGSSQDGTFVQELQNGCQG